MDNNGPAGTLICPGGAVLNSGAGGIRRAFRWSGNPEISGNIRKYPDISPAGFSIIDAMIRHAGPMLTR